MNIFILVVNGGTKELQFLANNYFGSSFKQHRDHYYYFTLHASPCWYLCPGGKEKQISNKEHLLSDRINYLLHIFQIVAEREELQQDIDALMSWIKDTEKQLKAPLKLRFKSEDVEKQLEKMKELQVDVTEHESGINKAVADAEAIMKQSKGPVKAELKNKNGW